ncbi:MAG TPA: hypothetical protein VIY72_00135 [Acidimicrobiales bacterium]
MSGLAFLLIVVVVTLVGSFAVWLRHRKPTHFMSSVDDFQREMDALGRSPGTTPKGQRSRRSRRSDGGQ